MDEENLAADKETPVEAPLEGTVETKTESPTTQDEVPVATPETMKVSWGAADQDPVQTGHPVRLIRVYANVDGRQLRVMKTADGVDCLHIFVDVV